ncbi:MAG TPA: Ig-like domain-containing protein [Polyangiaceae bacterium]|nr:Ig-like domain-containing protein [Polyangiaceae bacterium]
MKLDLSMIVFAFSSLLGAGCSKVLGEPPSYAFSFTIRVASDDGTPIKGAQIGTSSSQTATTDDAGRARLEVTGREGDRRPFLVRCPSDFQSPPEPLVISLHHNAEGAASAVYSATCVPFKRTVVVAVRLEGGPGLPIYYLDEEVARTDESGAAHFIVKAVPGEPFRIAVRTQEVDEDLRPIDPTAELSVGASDDIVLFEQTLSRVVRYVPRSVRPRRLLAQKL